MASQSTLVYVMKISKNGVVETDHKALKVNHRALNKQRVKAQPIKDHKSLKLFTENPFTSQSRCCTLTGSDNKMMSESVEKRF